MRSLNCLLPTLSLVFLIALPTLNAFDWADYPVCAQTQLENLAPLSCDTGNLYTSNNCLCSDTSFLDAAALAIYNNCDCTDLTHSANTMVSNCDASGTPSVLTVGEFIAAGDGGSQDCGGDSSSSDSPAPANTSGGSGTSSSSNNNSQSSDGGLSRAAEIGTIVGTVAGVIGTAVAIWMCCCRSR